MTAVVGALACGCGPSAGGGSGARDAGGGGAGDGGGEPVNHCPDDSFPSYCSGNRLSPQERVLLYLILHVADCIGDVE